MILKNNKKDVMKNNHNAVVAICSDFEWMVVKDLIKPEILFKSVYGEYFTFNEVLFFQTGWTKTVASAGVQFIIDTYKPELLINIGTCGGFSEHVQVGEVLLVAETAIYDLHERMGDPDEVIKKFRAQLDISCVKSSVLEHVTIAHIVSADADVDVKNVQMLHAQFEAVAADWESGSIAYVAKINNQKLIILRGVSDLVSEDGAEVYGNEDLFLVRTRSVMASLLEVVEAQLSTDTVK